MRTVLRSSIAWLARLLARISLGRNVLTRHVVADVQIDISRYMISNETWRWTFLTSPSPFQSFKKQILSVVEIIVLRLYSAGSQLSWPPEAHQTCIFFFVVTSAVKSLNV